VELVVSEFSGEVKQAILDRMNREYLATGKFVRDQMSVSPKIMSSLMLSGAAAGTAVSASMSASLFMATVPMSGFSTLETLRNRCKSCGGLFFLSNFQINKLDDRGTVPVSCFSVLQIRNAYGSVGGCYGEYVFCQANDAAVTPL